MFEEDDVDGWKGVEGAAEDTIEGPEGGSEENEKRTEVNHLEGLYKKSRKDEKYKKYEGIRSNEVENSAKARDRENKE